MSIARLCLAIAGLALAAAPSAASPIPADFAAEPASRDARLMAAWVIESGDNDGLSFLIVDKIGAKVFAFSARGRMLGASPALLGLGRGDDSAAGIGTRKLADIPRELRNTPSGRFVARLGPDLGTKDVLWVDYDAAISLHRVFTGNASERRLERLATASTLDNRISYGCINVPAAFYENTVRPLFAASPGIVYVLPETRSLANSFPRFRPGSRPLASR